MMEARQPNPTLVSYVHVMYGLHALSALIGITSSVTVAGSFIFGIPSIIAIIMNYVRRGEAEGTWLGSHFAWQRRTFWYAAFWTLMTGIVSGLFLIILVGVVTWFLGLAIIALWIIYRVLRGWIALGGGQPVLD